MTGKKFLLLQSNPIFYYTLDDLKNKDNVIIIHKKRVSNNRWKNLLFNIHYSGKLQKYIELPFKSIWDYLLFDNLLKSFMPDYILFTTSWYSDHLVAYFRTNCKSSKLVFRFTDKISNSLGKNYDTMIGKIKSQFDGVLVYSKEDASRYGLTYHSVGYSIFRNLSINPRMKYDVVFVGAEKGRIDKIRQAYNIFSSVGLNCFFYVTMVKPTDRKDDGIIYADKGLSFTEYLTVVLSSRCLFELVQEGSSGRTFRMMEAIMYNKMLVTNCTEIFKTEYFMPDYIQIFRDVAEINPKFVVNYPAVINYNYKGDFSPERVLDFISRVW